MNRRDFTQSIAATTLLAGPASALASLRLSPTALAAATQAQEGREYRTLPTAVPVTGNKIEVIEFFGYWCPHCSGFDPKLESWVRSLDKSKISFRRVPVAVRPNQEPLRKLYLALESVGMVDALHAKVFAAIHTQRRRMDRDADIAQFLTEVAPGDSKKVLDAIGSLSMVGKINSSKRAFESFSVEGVPMLAIQGKWLTGPGFNINFDRTLAVADQLIAKAAQR